MPLKKYVYLLGKLWLYAELATFLMAHSSGWKMTMPNSLNLGFQHFLKNDQREPVMSINLHSLLPMIKCDSLKGY